MAERLKGEKGGDTAAPSPDDAWQKRATHEAAMAMGEWLMASGRLDNRVRDLRRADLEGMATAAISRFIRECSRRPGDLPAPIANLLLGA